MSICPLRINLLMNIFHLFSIIEFNNSSILLLNAFNMAATSTSLVEVVLLVGSRTTTKELRDGGYCANGIGANKL